MRVSRFFAVLLLGVMVSALSGCGYNDLQTKDESVKASWSEVINQYQRRADLVPNLVSTVQGYAAQEKSVLTEVTQARASVGQMKITPEMVIDPEAMKRFSDAQGEFTNALSRLLVVSENYPNLKSDALFRDLSAQLEGTENRIAVARRDFILAVQKYNTEIRTFPGRLWHSVMYSDLPIREPFEATTPGAEKAPEVKF